jgi:hypothetical protein
MERGMDWLNALNVWPSMRSLTPSRIGKVFVMSCPNT